MIGMICRSTFPAPPDCPPFQSISTIYMVSDPVPGNGERSGKTNWLNPALFLHLEKKIKSIDANGNVWKLLCCS